MVDFQKLLARDKILKESGTAIVPTDDIRWRRAFVGHFAGRDSWRSHEIHITDLINCCMTSYRRKLFPEEATAGAAEVEARYGKLLTWNRGIAFDQILTESFTEGKHHFKVNDIEASVDTMFEGVPYEFTSSNFVPKVVKTIWEAMEPVPDLGGKYEYKVEQARLYMAGLGVRMAKLKIVELIGKVPREFTFEVHMTPAALAKKRVELLTRRDILWNTLRWGSWSSIPPEFRPILKDALCAANREGICEDWAWAKAHPNEMDKAWMEWIYEHDKRNGFGAHPAKEGEARSSQYKGQRPVDQTGPDGSPGPTTFRRIVRAEPAKR
jgi:hypothetical protein